MPLKRASDLAEGDLLVFRVSNGATVALVQIIEPGSQEDRLPWNYLKNPRPMLRIHVALKRPVSVPSLPGRKTHFWTIWHYPDDMVETHERRR